MSKKKETKQKKKPTSRKNYMPRFLSKLSYREVGIGLVTLALAIVGCSIFFRRKRQGSYGSRKGNYYYSTSENAAHIKERYEFIQ